MGSTPAGIHPGIVGALSSGAGGTGRGIHRGISGRFHIGTCGTRRGGSSVGRATAGRGRAFGWGRFGFATLFATGRRRTSDGGGRLEGGLGGSSNLRTDCPDRMTGSRWTVVRGDPHIVHTGPGSEDPPHHEHDTRPDLLAPLEGTEEEGPERAREAANGREAVSGEPQISQTGPRRENNPHHSHAIFVSVMTIRREASTPLL
jgi:hypothetical protein